MSRYAICGWPAVVVSLSVTISTAADPLGPLMTELSSLKPGEGCVSVKTGTLAQAALEVTLGAGTACPIAVGELKLGWFFAGDAKFRYLSKDRVEHPVLRFNANTEGRVDVQEIDGALSVTGDVHTVLFLTWSKAPASLSGEPAKAPSKAFGEHVETFARYDGLSSAHRLAGPIVERAAAPVVRAELDGGAGPLVYTYDPIDTRAETLEILGSFSTSDREVRRRLRTTVLSSQAIGRDPRVPVAAPFAMTDVDYELIAPGGNAVSITARTTVVPGRDGMRLLDFTIPGTILAEEGPGSSTPRAYRISSITDGAGQPLAHHRGSRDVLIDLGTAAKKGQASVVVFKVDGDFLVRPNGDNYWILERDELFPQPALAGAQYTTHGVIHVKKPFVPFASGAIVKRYEDGEMNVVEVRSELFTIVPVVIAGRYTYSEQSRDGLTVRVASYAVRNVRAQEQLSELAFAMIRHMERFLGPFPVPELNIIQVNDLGWGQAPLGTMLITNEAFDRTLPPDIAQFFTEGINERFAHEIAHQWWGHAIRWPNDEEVWLSESFAEYCAGLMVKRAQGKGVFDNLKASWKFRAKNATKVAPVALAQRISGKDGETRFEHRFGLLYAKGPWLLANIHDQLGDEKFLTFLKSYQKTLKGKTASTKQMAELLRVLSGKDFGPYFEANFWGTAMPN